MYRFLFILCLLGSYGLHAQKFVSQELSAGVVIGTSYTLKDLGIFKKSMDGRSAPVKQSTGAWHITYRVLPLRRIDLGVSLIGESQKRSTTSMLPELQDKFSSHKDLYLSALASFHFHWAEKPHFQLYSGAGLGLNMQQRKELHNDFSSKKEEFTRYGLAWQGTAFGMRVGKKFGGYFEVGYGYKGIVLAGLSLRL